MFAEWISSLRREAPAADPPFAPPSLCDPATVHALAAGVQQLCTVCEELLALAARSDPSPGMAQRLIYTIPEQIEAVRACASDIQYRETLCAPLSDDSYSLAALGQWVWNE